MKKTNLFLIIILLLNLNVSCRAQENKLTDANKKLQSEDVEVYYFHLTNRCVTCKAIESESKKAVEELYHGEIAFKVFNFQDKENSEIIKDLDIKGQMLFIRKGDTKIDLTREGFLYARTDPEKLKQVIKENIDPLLY
ncbi:MAG TPA: nitrophenyl compound nitroreductase subunit ArsF family protein [Bacteroidales bacterium]|nr:nitrophenyl compound nitroreductase subunit ArsF family protein [Bacteroidales bacterium]